MADSGAQKQWPRSNLRTSASLAAGCPLLYMLSGMAAADSS
jgi:hypothetical protein